MDLKAEKLQLIQQILPVDDVLLINAVKNLLSYGMKVKGQQAEAVTDFWTALSPHQKAQIELSIQQLGKGQGIPHDKVMTEFRENIK